MPKDVEQATVSGCKRQSASESHGHFFYLGGVSRKWPRATPLTIPPHINTPPHTLQCDVLSPSLSLSPQVGWHGAGRAITPHMVWSPAILPGPESVPIWSPIGTLEGWSRSESKSESRSSPSQEYLTSAITSLIGRIGGTAAYSKRALAETRSDAATSFESRNLIPGSILTM